MTIIKPKITDSQYHHDMKLCISKLGFVNDEIRFLDQLLNSYSFHPETPNLYERLELFKGNLDESKKRYHHLIELVKKHDQDLGELIENSTDIDKTPYDGQHLQVMDMFDDFVADYELLKQNIFKYCGGILKQSKHQ